MKEKLFFAVVVYVAFSLWLNIYTDQYEISGMPYGKSDIIHYVNNVWFYVDFGDIHFLYSNLTNTLSYLWDIPYPLLLTYFVPFTGTVFLGLTLWLSFPMFGDGRRLFCCLGLFIGSYLMFANNTVCILAQFMSLLFFYLTMPYIVLKDFKNPVFILLSGLSIAFHTYTLLFYLFVYSMSRKRWWLLFVFIGVLAMVLRPHTPLEWTFLSSHYNETSPYEHLFYFINPYLLGLSMFAALYLRDPYIKRLYWGLFLIGFVSHISRALPFFLWIMVYIIFKNPDFKVKHKIYWLITVSSFIWIDHIAFLFAKSV